MADTKLSEIADGNALVPATDQVVAVRNGNTDVLVDMDALNATTITAANEASDTTCFPLFVTAATGNLGGKTNAGLTFNSSNGTLGATTFSGAGTGLTGTAASFTAGAVAVGGITGLGSNVATFLATPSSANLAAAVTDETGSGALVFATSPTLVTPVLGVATATSINKVAITAPASSATITIADGKTITASNTLTFTGTDSSSVAFGAGGTVAYLGTVQAYSKQQTLTPQALSSSSNSIAWDANNGNNASHAATENTTLANPTNLVTGTVYTFQWTQNASAAKTLAFGNKWKFAGSSTVSATLSSVQIITGLYDGTNINSVMTGPFS